MKKKLTLTILFLYSLHGFSTDTRLVHRLGLGAGILGDPFPQSFGVGLSYNIFDFLRMEMSYGGGYATGGIGSAHSLSFGPTFFLPNWSLSPAFGIHWASVFGSANISTPEDFGKNGRHLMAVVGLDWQARTGFSCGAGFNIPLRGKVGSVPYVRMAWYF